MQQRSFRRPSEVLRGLAIAGAEVIRARDPILGSRLDVPPPSVETRSGGLGEVANTTLLRAGGLVYRGLRKGYRVLKRIGPLTPALRYVKESVLRIP